MSQSLALGAPAPLKWRPLLMVATGLVLTGLLLNEGCQTRQQRWDGQNAGQRLRDGLRNPSNNPPGKGFNTSD